jgi:uncharacterized protein (DUF736 family)
MTTIGQLIRIDSKEKQAAEYKGSVSTLLLDLTFEARRIPPRADKPGAPTHRLFAWNSSGTEVEIGAMWEKAATKPEHEGEPYFTFTFSDPSFEKSLNAAAFKPKNGKPGVYEITFRNRPGKPAARAVSSGAAA